MSGDDDRRGRLLGVKLRTLVSEHLADPADPIRSEPQGFPGGAALVHGDQAWVLLDGVAARGLGPALAWALRAGAASLDIVADHDTGLLARRAQQLVFPVRVWFAESRTLLPAVIEPLPDVPAPRVEHLEFVATIESAGATATIEHGIVAGEVRGLEVCRVVDEPTVGHVTELGDIAPAVVSDIPAGVSLEVGVGPNDREAFRMLHGDIPTVDALAAVVDSVRGHRSDPSAQHPLNRLGQERFLRWELEQQPARLDMVEVTPTEPPLPRPILKDPIPCVARAIDESGAHRHVVCSVGVDVDLVGFVADVQAMADAPVIVVLRERDAIGITRDLLAQLRQPVELRVV